MANTASNYLEEIWNNPEAMERFKTSPRQFLNDQGANIPDDVHVQAHVETPTERIFVLPADQTKLPEGNDPVTKVIRQALSDENYKKRLIEHPSEVVMEAGIPLHQDVKVKVYQNTDAELHAVIPPNPARAELGDSELETVAGGGIASATCTGGGIASGAVCGVATVPTTGVTAVASAAGVGYFAVASFVAG